MATLVLRDAKIWWDGHDFSGDHNQIALDYSADMLDETAFGDNTHIRKGGLKNVLFTGNGWWDGDTDRIDPTAFAKVGVDGNALAISPGGGSEGDVAYFFKPIAGSYNPGATIGELLAFEMTAEARHNLVRGTVMQNGTETATGSGTSRQLGAVTTTDKHLYAALHVFSASGTSPTLDVTIRSDDNTGMTTPETRVTFSQATGRSSQWATPVSGAITDDWWDIEWTIGGTTPEFNFAVVVGIL